VTGLAPHRHPPGVAVEALKARRPRRAEQCLRAGRAWVDHDLVNCHADGTPEDAANRITRRSEHT
jgi:hypothetical protein